MSRDFSNINRTEKIQKAQQDHYDLIVIGGGVTGCGIALDATLRGIKTLLIEKRDYASGTSSKSTKLIHGGLRYLKQFEFGLVRETGVERAVVHRLAPHLVHPEKMLLPIVKGGTFGKFSASMAISVYDLLANVSTEDKKVSLGKKETMDLEPLVKSDILNSSILYSEYRTDDARLTIELIKKAVEKGCSSFNYLEMEEGIYNDQGNIQGVKLFDKLNNVFYDFKGKNIVSAAGPWVDKIRSKDKSLKGSRLHLTKGVHIVLDREKLPLNQSVYFDDFSGRMIFAIPRGKTTYIGTSDTNYSKDLNQVYCTHADAKYLLKVTNRYFDIEPLTTSDIKSSWAGLRPLIHQEGKSPSELSRKDEIFTADSGLISIAGGKLTGYRKMAERIVDLVQKNNGSEITQTTTESVQLCEEAFENYSEVSFYIDRLTEDLNKYGLTAYSAWYLISTYGKYANRIVEKFVEKKGEDKIYNLLEAELEYCVKSESVAQISDFLIRRTGKLYFEYNVVTKYHKALNAHLAELMTRTETNQQSSLEEIKRELTETIRFREEPSI